MSASTPRPPRRRPRRGSLERPVSGRTYRGTWLLVALPLLLAAFTVTRPAALPAPSLPAAFDAAGGGRAREELRQGLSRSLAADDRRGRRGRVVLGPAARRTALRRSPIRSRRRSPDGAALRFVNVLAVAPGRSQSAIVVMAHRDNTGDSPGAVDNASGTAALIELARSYANPAASSSTPSSSKRVSPSHTIVFLSTDGGSLGGVGAAHFAAHSALARDVVAVINLDSIATRGPTRIQIAGDTPRSPSTTLVATAAARILEQTRSAPRRPSALRQLLDLGFPFSFYEQAPFLAHGISAITLTSAGDRPPSVYDDSVANVRTGRLGQIGRSAQQLLASLDEGLELTQGTSTYVYLGSRIVRGWAIELVLVAALLPFLAAAVDLFALTRRRRIRLTPAVRSLRTRLGFWVWVVVLFELLGLVGLWAHAGLRPPAPQASAGTNWPVAGLIVLAALSFVGWLISRDRLLPKREVTTEEELAGHAVALLALGLVGILVAALNAFALIFVLPSLHAWLWLPQLRFRPLLSRLATLLIGFLGPALLFWDFAYRFGLGLDAPWYILQLIAIGWTPLVGLLLVAAWAASGGQLAALAAGRYAPYPDARERPPLGPVRRSLRRVILSSRARRRERLQAEVGDGPTAVQG